MKNLGSKLQHKIMVENNAETLESRQFRTLNDFAMRTHLPKICV